MQGVAAEHRSARRRAVHAVIIPSLHDLLHPLEGAGYQFWSGLGSDLGELSLLTGLAVVAYRAHKHVECHVEQPSCHRIGHPVPGTGYRACRVHHPAMKHVEPTTAAHIDSAHRDASS